MTDAPRELSPGLHLGRLRRLPGSATQWQLDINGEPVTLLTAELMDQRRFHRRLIERFNTWPPLLPPLQWQALVRALLAEMEAA